MKKIRKKGLILLLLVLAAIPIKTYYENRKMQEEIAEKILRFHVIANSDSKEDQELKLKVRDAVGLYMKDEMKQVNSRKEAEQTANENLRNIEKIAEEVIKKEGKSYPVKALVGQVDFPIKTYGSYSFPAGTYEALEVVIGDGSGKNWWCVMYPNMCFQDSMYGVIDQEAQTSLQEVLTEKEYDSIIDNHNYKIQFKYLTFLNRIID